MSRPQKPGAYKSLKDFSALEDLLRGRHVEKVQNEVTNSIEHTFPITSYAEEENLDSIAALTNYAPSAFDEGTIQDIKYHKEADEIYFLLAGSLTIHWKQRNSESIQGKITINKDKRFAYIPKEHCLLVTPTDKNAFLAIALKTQKSTIGNGGKIQGTNCPCYKEVTCSIRSYCERIRRNRGDFFAHLEHLRQEEEKLEKLRAEEEKLRVEAATMVHQCAGDFCKS